MAARFQNHHPSSRFEPPYVRPVGPPNLSPQDTSSFVRPLSDIREITEPSIADIVASRPAPDRNPHSNQQPPKPQRQPSAAGRATSVRIVDPQQTISKGKQRLETHFSSDTGSEQGADVSSAFGIPSASVPQRTASRKSAGADTPALYGHAHSAAPTRINEPPRQSSPSRRRPAQLNSEASQRIPSQTVIRDPCPFDVVDQPTLKHHRLHAYLQVIAPLFVGGGSIEGFVQIAVETPERQRGRHNIFLSRVAIDLLGVEELVGQHRRSVFLSLGTELISAEQPPPAHMTRSPIPLSYRDPHWILQPSNSTLPFRLSLPLDVGSAPFTSKSARVRFQLSVSVHFAEGDHRFIVRNSQAVTVLSTYDPLRSLPSPLTAFDEIHMAKSDHIDVIGLTARLHRQVWVSGTSIFVDVHIANNSRKVVRRMDLSIERATLFYKHSAAATLEKSASQARIFEDKEQTILSKTTVKLSTAGRNGVAPYSDTTRTCNIDIPRDHATVRCGKFFEVRYFLNISAGTSHALLSVQLPIILIHMNSLDVVPNAVGQVTVAIEEKRAQHHEAQARKLSGQSDHAGGSSKQQSRHAAAVQSHKSRKVQSIQGRAFAAPRSQSLDRMKAQAADLEQLGHELERSPRRMHNSGRRARYSPERPASRAPQPPPKDPRLRSPSYRHTDQHRFGLSGNNSQNSFAGPGIGSYTMLNGGSTAAMADAVIGNAPYTQQYTGLTDTVRRKIRSLKSLESFHRRPSRSEMRTTRSPSPYHAHANAGHDGTADIPLPPTFTRKHIQLPRSILRVGSSPARGRQRRTADEIYSAERAHHDYGTVDTRSRSAARQPGHIPAKSGLASRASSRLRDSFDRGRFEFPAVGWNQRSTEENNGAGLTAGITEGVKGLLRKGKEVVEGVMSPAKGNVEVAVPTISRPEWIEGARVGWL